jgi:hypothetical protein
MVIDSPQLGLLDLLGPRGDELAAQDLEALADLFDTPVRSAKQPPRCDVLLIYARIDDTGRIAASDLGLREIIRDAGARIVVVASEQR